MGTFFSVHVEQVLAVEGDGAFCHLVGWIADDDIGEGGLACTIGAHESMNLTVLDGQIDALQYFLIAHFGVEVLDF